MLSALSNRERDILSVASVIIMLFLMLHFIFLPAIERRQSLVKQLNAKQEALKEMAEFEKRYTDIKHSVEEEKRVAMRRDRSFTLFSFIDRLAQESNVKDNVAYMKPSTRKSENGDILFSSVKVKLDGIVMKQAVDFLHKIETSENFVHILSLSLSKAGDEQKLSVIIETETIMTSGS